MTAVATDRDRNGPRDLISVAADGLAVEGGSLVRLSLVELVESPWNPRKHFDPARLAEMVESLKKGQLAPIIVRPYREPQASGTNFPKLYEIGAGHRRFRAAPAAGMTSLLAIVRELDDVAFLELLTIENKQRDDVAPLDEANGFKLLMEKAGYDVAKLAARIGLSTKYVYDRLKLLQLVPAAKKLLEEGVITAGHAILLARLSPTDQKRAIGDIEDAAGAGRYGRPESLLLRPDTAAEGDELPLHDRVKPVSVREFQHAIQREIRATPERVDPFLFPESAAALEAAKEEKLSVIHITRDYRVSDEARDEKIKTYGSEAWKRADGAADEEDWRGRKIKSKPCAFSRYGFVASGPGQGEVFKVCINKQKCSIHWPEQVKALKEREKRAKQGSSGSQKSADAAARAAEREVEREQLAAKRQERRDNALPQVLAGLRDSLTAAIAKRAAGFDRVPDQAMMILADAEIYISNHKGARLYGDRVERFIAPHLPGKWQKGTQWDAAQPLDAKASRQWFGLALYLALDSAKLDATIKGQIDTIVADEEKAEKKPISKKAKKVKR